MSFPADSHAKAYVCNHVFEGSRPILLVSRVEGDWCFLCGDYHEDNASAYKVVGIGHVIDSDGTLLELHDLPADWEAERQNTDSKWTRSLYDPSSED
jgi:hypothetical protein